MANDKKKLKWYTDCRNRYNLKTLNKNGLKRINERNHRSEIIKERFTG